MLFRSVDDNLRNFITWYYHAAVKFFLSDDGQCGGNSPVDWTIDPITKQRDAKPSREQKKAMMKLLLETKRNPASGYWYMESINEGIWENVVPVKNKLIHLIESGMLGGTQGVVDAYIEYYKAEPQNMTRFKDKEFVYHD